MAVAQTLGVVDYIVSGSVLVISLAIGIYYGCTGGKQRTTEEFLLADRKMPILPVAMSLLASFLSSVTVMGTPAEVYRNGTLFLVSSLGFFIMTPVTAYVFHPVFFNLRITSVFEYLEMRFSKGVRILAAILYLTQMTLYLSIVLYGPSLALNAVTGLDVWLSVFTAGIICTIYTSLGGMKAVMWTDTFQVVMMIAGLLAVLIRGSMDVGGWGNLWEIANEGQRIRFFNWDLNPFVRHTNWNLVIGIAFTWISVFGTNQAQVQRILSCPTLRHAQIATWINLPGLTFITTLAGLCGIVIFSHYRLCDPISNKRVTGADQLLPLYVLERFQDIPGFAGLVVACILSAALSTFSSGLNSLAAVTFQDIFMNIECIKQMSDEKSATVSKLLAVAFGVIAMCLCFLVSFWGAILSAAYALFGMIAGPLLGLFILGMIYPWTNTKGAYCGLLFGVCVTVFLGIGARISPQPIIPPPLPVSTAGCNLTDDAMFNMTTQFVSAPALYVNVTTTEEAPTSPSQDPGFSKIFQISYMWYNAIALTLVTVVGLLVSFITGATDPKDIDRALLSPLTLKLCSCVVGKNRKKTDDTDSDFKKQEANYNNKAFDADEKLP